MQKTIIIFGHGYVAKFLIQKLNALGWIIYCTSRQIEVGKPVKNENVTQINFLDPAIPSLIKSADALLSTVPPNNDVIDPVLHTYAEVISKSMFEWIGYLSSTSVYGNHNGAWVTEETQCAPTNEQSRIRLLAEQQWLKLYSINKLPVHILRLSGIYGPDKNCLEQIKKGKNFTVIKENQFFSRIHVEDICMATIASIESPTAGEIYNISDDQPAPINVVQQFGASILNAKSLHEIPFEVAGLSDQAKHFFHDNKKVSGEKIKRRLHIAWTYPNYIVGLTKALQQEKC